MIHEVAIRNYQSLQSVTLKLGNVTIITGHTDAGKSAFIRALERACFNDSGFSFISTLDSEMAEKAQVAIRTDLGVVIWTRSKTTVNYKVVRDGKETSFTKLGRGYVPEDVVQVLGIRPIRVDAGAGAGSAQRIQFSGQFDLPFLVADRGGVAASRVLGRLTGLNVFSSANKTLSSDKTVLNGKLGDTEQARDEKATELRQFEGLEALATALTALKARIAYLQKRQARLAEYKRLQKHRDQVQAALESQDIEATERTLLSLESMRDTFRVLWNKLSALMRLERITLQATETDRQLHSLIDYGPPPAITVRPRIEQLDKLRNLRAQCKSNSKISDGYVFLIAESEDELECRVHELVQAEASFPLCPFKMQFETQKGSYRCRDLMKVIQGE